MQALSINTAHQYVLQALDEIKNLEAPNMLAGTDELDTEKLVKGYIIEAVLKSHKDAPSHLLDGVVDDVETDCDIAINDDLSVDIRMNVESARLVSLLSSDSLVLVTEYATEESAIGRMQNNPYVRGTYDDPRLIIKKVWQEDRKPEYVYYSVLDADSNPSFTLEYIPYPVVGSDGAVQISDKMEYAVLNLLVSMVLNALSYHDKATLYLNKYQEYLQTAR